MPITPLHRSISPSPLPVEQISGNTQLSEAQKVEEVCRKFEAVLLRQILAEANKTVLPSKFIAQSSVHSIYQDMTIHQLADNISQSGKFGLADALRHQLSVQLEKQQNTIPNSSSPPAASHPISND